MKYRGFCGPSYTSQAVTADAERLVNWYVERMESRAATTQMALYPTPGMKFLGFTDTSPGRAHEFYDGREFIVSGSTFYEMDETGTATFLATLAVDSNPATISWNGDGGGQLFITSGGNGYYMTLSTNVVTQITALNGKATIGAALDGYFLALDENTGTFYASDLLDGTTWTTGTMFAQRISAPDPWIGMTVFGKYIWLFGSQTSEVWFNNGASPFPFAQYPGSLIPYGVASAWSSKVVGSSIMWLAASKEGQGQVMRASGFTPENIASYPVQYAIGQYDHLDSAYADTYSEAGHTFYVLSFLSPGRTWAYDTEMQMWHERGTWDPTFSSGDFTVWRPRCHALAFGQHRWLDTVDGGVYIGLLTQGTDEVVSVGPGGLSVGDLAIRRLRRGPTINSENSRLYVSALEVDLEAGLGTTSGQGVNPQVMMRLSNDGGRTWSAERMRASGKTGVYSQRVRWERCGMGRKRSFEISVTDPIPWRVTDAYVHGSSLENRGGA